MRDFYFLALVGAVDTNLAITIAGYKIPKADKKTDNIFAVVLQGSPSPKPTVVTVTKLK